MYIGNCSSNNWQPANNKRYSPRMTVHCVDTIQYSQIENFKSKYDPHYTEHKIYILHSRKIRDTPPDS